MRRWIVVVLAFGILAGCGSSVAEQTATAESAAQAIEQTATATCLADVKVYQGDIESAVEAWDDAVKLADKTGRGQLAMQVANLQSVKRDADSVNVPTCGIAAHAYLMKSMEATIDGYLAFMEKKTDEEVFAYFKDAKAQLSAFKTELASAITGK